MYINPAFLAGIQLKKLGFNYSYDLHRLSIGTTSPQLNAHELSIRYLFDGKKKAKTGIED